MQLSRQSFETDCILITDHGSATPGARESELVNNPAPTWTCPRCGANASTGQRFCRQCGDPLDDIEAIRSGTRLRPLSRLLIALIIVIFLAIGGLAAALLDDIRNQPPDPSGQGSSSGSTSPTVGSPAEVGTRPITNTDWPKGGRTRDSIHRVTGTT